MKNIFSIQDFIFIVLFVVAAALAVLGGVRDGKAENDSSILLIDGSIDGELFTDGVFWHGADRADIFFETDDSIHVAVQASPDGNLWVTGKKNAGDFREGSWLLPAVPVTGEFLRLRIESTEPTTVTAIITVHE